jgi:hypothetical protein
MTSTYAFETAEECEALFRGEREVYVYGRTRNPTQGLFEERIASLEGAETAPRLASAPRAGFVGNRTHPGKLCCNEGCTPPNSARQAGATADKVRRRRRSRW